MAAIDQRTTHARYIWRIFRRSVAIALRAIFQPGVENRLNPELLPTDSNRSGYLTGLYPGAECPGGYSQDLCDLIVINQFVHEPFSELPSVRSKATSFIRIRHAKLLGCGGVFAAGPSPSVAIGVAFRRYERVLVAAD